jgi:precorrin-2 dehydrogenase/sirohydrochlorin ferrochelatase
MRNYFPVSLDVEDRHCLIIGGDAEAEDKAKKLLDAKAKVTLVSPKVTEGLKAFIDAHRLTWRQGRFSPHDLIGQFLAMLCVKTDPELTEQVYRLCRNDKILLCAYDQPKWCDFAMPAIVNCGRLCVAISTGGAAPALAKKIRQDLEAIFDEKMARFLDGLAEQRERLEKEEPNLEVRREKLKKLVRDFKIEGHISFPA